MKELKLPVISVPLPEKKQLSMDDYLKFVQFNLQYTTDIEASRQWKKMLAVTIPFSIKYS